MNPELDLGIDRVIRAPRKHVWDARTDPAHLAQWWVPAPTRCGSARLGSVLLSMGLVDTLRLVVAPAVLGSGRRLLTHPAAATRLRLVRPDRYAATRGSRCAARNSRSEVGARPVSRSIVGVTTAA